MTKNRKTNRHHNFIRQPYRKALVWQVGQPIKNRANLPLLYAGPTALGNLAALGDTNGGEL